LGTYDAPDTKKSEISEWNYEIKFDLGSHKDPFLSGPVDEILAVMQFRIVFFSCGTLNENH
jgi:hypothetical protein